MSGDKHKPKAPVLLLANDKQVSPRATLEGSLVESNDWEQVVIVYRKKGDPFNIIRQRFGGDIDYPHIQWLLGQAMQSNSLECINLQAVIDEQEGL